MTKTKYFERLFDAKFENRSEKRKWFGDASIQHINTAGSNEATDSDFFSLIDAVLYLLC